MSEALAYESDSDAVRVRVPAKINLHLGVGPRRDDGFHDLTTVYQAISLYDEVTVEADARQGIHVEVEGVGSELVPRDDSNLAVRAVRLLGIEYGIKPEVTVRLHKRIPVAGGLAGGSADAAGALLAAARLWDLGADEAELSALAARLGSDVPFCILGGTALGTGHGERVEPVPDTGRYHWVVATADGQISTPRAYAEVDRLRDNGIGAYTSDVSALLEALGHGCPSELAECLHNDMAAAARSLRPGLSEVSEAGLADGALAALVSGSGPTTLFLTRDTHHAHALAARLRMRRVAHEIHLATGPVPGARVM